MWVEKSTAIHPPPKGKKILWDRVDLASSKAILCLFYYYGYSKVRSGPVILSILLRSQSPFKTETYVRIAQYPLARITTPKVSLPQVQLSCQNHKAAPPQPNGSNRTTHCSGLWEVEHSSTRARPRSWPPFWTCCLDSVVNAYVKGKHSLPWLFSIQTLLHRCMYTPHTNKS